MKRTFPHLCSPLTIGNVTFRNRMFSAPMGGTDITNDGCIGPKSTAFYELRARGGAAAVTVSECMVHPQTDGSHAYHLDTSILNSLASFRRGSIIAGTSTAVRWKIAAVLPGACFRPCVLPWAPLFP